MTRYLSAGQEGQKDRVLVHGSQEEELEARRERAGGLHHVVRHPLGTFSKPLTSSSDAATSM